MKWISFDSFSLSPCPSPPLCNTVYPLQTRFRQIPQKYISTMRAMFITLIRRRWNLLPIGFHVKGSGARITESLRFQLHCIELLSTARQTKMSIRVIQAFFFRHFAKNSDPTKTQGFEETQTFSKNSGPKTEKIYLNRKEIVPKLT